jgi:hypothetical protein
LETVENWPRHAAKVRAAQQLKISQRKVEGAVAYWNNAAPNWRKNNEFFRGELRRLTEISKKRDRSRN